MPLKIGTDQATVSGNIREMIRSGRKPKQAVAAALATKRQSMKMAAGGMVMNDEEPEDAGENRSIVELSDIAKFDEESPSGPEMSEHQMALAHAIDGMDDGYFSGGMIESDENKASDEAIEAATAEPMSSMPMKPAAGKAPPMLTDAAAEAIRMKKKNRVFRP